MFREDRDHCVEAWCRKVDEWIEHHEPEDRVEMLAGLRVHVEKREAEAKQEVV